MALASWVLHVEAHRRRCILNVVPFRFAQYFTAACENSSRKGSYVVRAWAFILALQVHTPKYGEEFHLLLPHCVI